MSRINEALLASVPATILAAELARREAERRRANQARPSQASGGAVRNRGPPSPIDIVSNEDLEAHTIESFCNAYQISRSALYDAWAKGIGPRFFRLGTAKRISVQAGRDWVRQLEEAAAPQTLVHDEATAE